MALNMILCQESLFLAAHGVYKMPFQNLPMFGGPASQPQQPQQPPILMGPPKNDPNDIMIEYLKQKFARERGFTPPPYDGTPYNSPPLQEQPKGFLQRSFERLL